MTHQTSMVVHDKLTRGLASEVRDELLELPTEAWDRYDNPFEQKWVLQRGAYSHHTQALVNHLNAHVVDIPEAELDVGEHYTAVFKYDVGDYLDLHMDAGVHPKNGKRKAWTVLYYLSTDDVAGGMLEFWGSDGMGALTGGGPVEVGEFIEPKFGTTVIFKNIDGEYHGNPTPVTKGVRLVVTVSFMSPEHGGFENFRQRAYFVPRAGIRFWGPEKFRLRDLRCDAEHYRSVYTVRRQDDE